MLTAKQKALHSFIAVYQKRNDGVSPSFAEMRDAMGLASKSGVHRHLEAMEKRGAIRRLHNRHQAIEVLDLRAQRIPIFDARTHKIRGYIQ